MSVLSDRDIIKKIEEDNLITIDTLNDVQPCSVDVHLAPILKKTNNKEYDILDEPYILKPGEFILGSTIEKVNIPNNLVALIDGKSSLARLGLSIHETAGWIDAGFKGNITLEIRNNGDLNIYLNHNMSIGQVVFIELSSPCLQEYGHIKRNNHYQNSNGTITSRTEEVQFEKNTILNRIKRIF